MGMERWTEFNWQKSRGTHPRFWSQYYHAQQQRVWNHPLSGEASPLPCEGLLHYQVSAAHNPFILSSLTIIYSSTIFNPILWLPALWGWDSGITGSGQSFGPRRQQWSPHNGRGVKQWRKAGRALSGLRGGVIEALAVNSIIYTPQYQHYIYLQLCHTCCKFSRSKAPFLTVFWRRVVVATY